MILYWILQIFSYTNLRVLSYQDVTHLSTKQAHRQLTSVILWDQSLESLFDCNSL